MSDSKFPDADWNILKGHPSPQVRDWFKRCMEDHPDEDNDEDDKYSWASPPSCTDWEEWFEKWFSQFGEE